MVRIITIIVFCTALCLPAYAAAQDGRSARCAPYRAQVESILAEYDLPAIYYWLMVAESGCRVGAVSPQGAVGFWQMMPATMRHHGCRNAEDLTCQTHAAARYLVSLRRRFTGEAVIWAWSMGGSNLKKRGKPTAEARALSATVRKLAQEVCTAKTS